MATQEADCIAFFFEVLNAPRFFDVLSFPLPCLLCVFSGLFHYFNNAGVRLIESDGTFFSPRRVAVSWL